MGEFNTELHGPVYELLSPAVGPAVTLGKRVYWVVRHAHQLHSG